MKPIIIIFLIPIFLLGENFNSYYTMIEKGNYDYIRENLPDLKAKYPNAADVLFLSGLVETNGESAVNIFTDFYKKFPQHDQADNAFMKIIEYNYTLGLYNKSIVNCSEFIKRHSNSELIEKCINIMINSYHAVDQADSANYFYEKYKNVIPHLNLTYDELQYKPSLEIVKKTELENNFVSYKNQAPGEFSIQSDDSYSLQFGAFTSPANALYLRDKLKSHGYNAYTKKIEGKNGPLVAVRVGYFENRKIAIDVGKEIKKKENLDYMVLKTN
ncbi:MAG: SPOR domain-containing protein [Candidatus Marinimicrobia bacterium]|nr:SPOR domain-containing protein [Candidatus Neomarinimicrobiota bacterium]